MLHQPKTSPAEQQQLYKKLMVTFWQCYCHAGFLPQLMAKAVEETAGDKDMWLLLGKEKLERSEFCRRAWGAGVPGHQSFSAVNF